MSLQDIRLLAAAYPGAFAAVSSMTAVNYHHGYSMAFAPFPYQTSADQIAALDCSLRHHHRILQEETLGRPSMPASVVAAAAAVSSGAAHGSGMMDALLGDGKVVQRSSPAPGSEMSSFSFLDSPDHIKNVESLNSSGMCF